jgi:hypothetical protein
VPGFDPAAGASPKVAGAAWRAAAGAVLGFGLVLAASGMAGVPALSLVVLDAVDGLDGAVWVTAAGVTGTGSTGAGLVGAGEAGAGLAAPVVAGFGAGFAVAGVLAGGVALVAVRTVVAVAESFDPLLAVLLGWFVTGSVGSVTGVTGVVGVATGSTGSSSAAARGAVNKNDTHAHAHSSTSLRPSRALACRAALRIVSHPYRGASRTPCTPSSRNVTARSPTGKGTYPQRPTEMRGIGERVEGGTNWG